MTAYSRKSKCEGGKKIVVFYILLTFSELFAGKIALFVWIFICKIVAQIIEHLFKDSIFLLFYEINLIVHFKRVLMFIKSVLK